MFDTTTMTVVQACIDTKNVIWWVRGDICSMNV